MAQKTTGLVSLFNNPWIYNTFQNVVGASKCRSILVNEFFDLKPSIKILDIGCGTSEILDHLPQDLVYVGFDLSEVYITAAKKKYQRRGTWHCKSVFDFDEKICEEFDIVIANGIIHHLDDEEALKLLQIAHDALKPSGEFISLENAITENQNLFARWIISLDRGENVRTPKGYNDLFQKSFSKIVCEVRTDMLRIPYTHIVSKCTKS